MMSSENPPVSSNSSFLLTTIPYPVLQAYQHQGGQSQNLVVAQASDLAADGTFGEQ